MSSEARVTANRRNAAKSTGPRTRQGKAMVAQNAITHGLRARRDLITGEDPREFALCRDGLLGELTPVGHRETLLAERIISLAWRLKRAERFQNQLFDYLLAKEIEQSLHAYDDELRLARKQGPAGVCSVPARAYPVAQPPSAGTAAEGGGAPCADSAEQSQPVKAAKGFVMMPRHARYAWHYHKPGTADRIGDRPAGASTRAGWRRARGRGFRLRGLCRGGIIRPS